ncbi:MAG: hypothetical protein R3318_01575, partial [Gammaproteobacteria bacterium]|nr:hypothetical protein [Gammaproteobacteria bacterium]
PTANLAVERHWFWKAGGFDENRRYGNDVLLTRRLIELSAPVRVEPCWVTYHEHYGLLGVLERTYRYGKSHGWRLAMFGSNEDDGIPIKTLSEFIRSVSTTAFKERQRSLQVSMSWYQNIFFRLVDITRNLLAVTGKWRGYRAGLKLRQMNGSIAG